MIALRTFFLINGLLFAVAMHAMDNDLCYVRFVNTMSDQTGVNLSFTKSILKYMRTLSNMQEDLDADLGSKEQPFILLKENIDIPAFHTLISLLKRLHPFLEKNPQASEYEIGEEIWKIITVNPKHYALCKLIIESGDYIGISPVIAYALKRCLSMLPHEKNIIRVHNGVPIQEKQSLDDAIAAGLTNINALPPDTVSAIKKETIKDIKRMFYSFLLTALNDHQKHHPKTTLQVPTNIKDTITNAKVTSDAVVDVCMTTQPNKIIQLVFDPSLTAQGIIPYAESHTALTLPYQFLGEFPNQHLLSESVQKLDLSSIRAPTTTDTVFMWSKDTYASYCFYYDTPTGRISVTYIYSPAYKKWIAIPNYVYGIEFFKNNDFEGLVCIVGAPGEANKKIVTIHLPTGTCTIKSIIPYAQVTPPCLCESLYIYSYKDAINNNTVLRVTDLNTDVVIYHPLMQPKMSFDLYTELVASYIDATQFFLFGITTVGGKSYCDTFTIDAKSLHVTFMNRDELPHVHMKVLQADYIPFHHLFIDYTHPDIAALQIPKIIHENGAVYVGGFDPNGRNFVLWEYVPSTVPAMLDELDDFDMYTMEQLYAVGEVLHRALTGTFAGMTKTEKKYIDMLKPLHKNLILNLLSWGKKGIYEPPMREFQ